MLLFLILNLFLSIKISHTHTHTHKCNTQIILNSFPIYMGKIQLSSLCIILENLHFSPLVNQFHLMTISLSQQYFIGSMAEC